MWSWRETGINVKPAARASFFTCITASRGSTNPTCSSPCVPAAMRACTGSAQCVGGCLKRWFRFGRNNTRKHPSNYSSLFETHAQRPLDTFSVGMYCQLPRREDREQRTHPFAIDLIKSHRVRCLCMKSASIRTSIDLPRDLHTRLHAAAAQKGCSARQLILASIEQAILQAEPSKPRRRLRLDVPLVRAQGRKPFDLNNEQIYELIEFP